MYGDHILLEWQSDYCGLIYSCLLFQMLLIIQDSKSHNLDFNKKTAVGLQLS